MKPAEAQALFAELCSAYPNAKVDADTLRIYQRELRPMSHELAKEAVVSAIGTCRFLPTIAELHHHYGIAREQHRRQQEAERISTERAIEDELPRPPLKDIPAATEYLAKLHDLEPRLNLESVSDGKCDDCPKEGARFKFYKLGLCLTCLVRRMKAKEKVEAA